MAVLVRLRVAHATVEQFRVLEERVGQALESSGGPPAGLMSHVVHPEDEGFVVAQVWRSEAEAQPHVEGQLRALMGELDLVPGETEVVPVWSFARP